MSNLPSPAASGKTLAVGCCDRCGRPIAVGSHEQVQQQLARHRMPAWLRERPRHRFACHSCKMTAIDALIARSRLDRERLAAALARPELRLSEVAHGG